MESFLVPTGVVAIAEIGDKTQLLAFVLAARFRKPVPIILGILLATLVNHGLAGALGNWFKQAIGGGGLRWVLGLSFIGMAVWALIPGRIDAGEAETPQRLGVFGATLVAFFFAEMGDKTQLATVAMAARYAAPVEVVLGTTLGMMIANVPAVFAAHRLVERMPMKTLRAIAAALFAALGLMTLLGVDAGLGL